MNLRLTAEFERFVQDKVRTGEYASPDRVVEAALLRLMEDDSAACIEAEELRKMIAVGQEEADRGELLDAEDVFEELRQRSERIRGKSRSSELSAATAT